MQYGLDKKMTAALTTFVLFSRSFAGECFTVVRLGAELSEALPSFPSLQLYPGMTAIASLPCILLCRGLPPLRRR